MAPGIHQMNETSWETLVLSILKLGLISPAGTIRQTEINLTGSKRIMLLLTFQLMKSSCRKTKNQVLRREYMKILNRIFDENELYRINNMSIEDKKSKLE